MGDGVRVSEKAVRADKPRLAPGGSGTRRSGRHLASVELQGRGSETGPNVHKAGARCSNKGFPPMSTADYLQLLDWTARQQREGKHGANAEAVRSTV